MKLIAITDYDDIVSSFPTYTLSKNKKNKLNQNWITKGRTQGVELNVVENQAELLAGDELYQTLHRQLKQRASDINAKVEATDTLFSGKWPAPINSDGVLNMTKEKA